MPVSTDIESRPPQPSALSIPSPLSTRALGAILAAISTLAFTLLYWNRFLSVSCAAAFLYPAELWLQGKVPYRDFFFIAPPLTLMKSALLIHWFGHTVAVLRIGAVIERVLLSGLVSWWLSRYFRATACFLGTFVAFVVFASDPADALASYHHESVFWAVLAGFSACMFLSRRRTGASLAALLSGFFCGLCFLTKQTTGAAITLCIPVVIAFLETGNLRRNLRFATWFGAGWIVPCGVTAGWLLRHHALDDFVTCVFLSGAAKGPAVAVFLRPFLDRPVLAAFVTVALLAGSRVIKRARVSAVAEPPILLVCVFAAMTASLPLAWHTAAGQAFPLIWAKLALAPFLAAALMGSLLLLARYGWLALRKDASPLTREIVLIGSVAAAIAYALSMSFAYYGPMVVPGLALVVAFATDRGGSGLRNLLCASVICFAVLFSQAESKLQAPSDWMDWPESAVPAAQYRSKFPQLRGLQFSESTGAIVDRLSEAIQANTRPGDTMLVYPYFPIFYSLTGLRHTTYSYSHYSDVAPDAVCRRDVQTLLRDPPTVILRMIRPESSLLRDEQLYRAGGASGVRRIEAALDELSVKYRVLETAEVPNTKAKLLVLLKLPDRPPAYLRSTFRATKNAFAGRSARRGM
jgi:hypothetical protein